MQGTSGPDLIIVMLMVSLVYPSAKQIMSGPFGQGPADHRSIAIPGRVIDCRS